MESGGFTIGSIRGIPIRVNVTFLLFLPFIALWFARAMSSAAAVADVPPSALRGSPLVWGVALALALFASVLLHELAHALYAIRHGGRVADITLLMFGGVSRITQPPDKIRQEATMALVGPLASLVLGAAFLTAHLFVPTTSFELRFGLFHLGLLNVFLGLFNLLPAFPMDGGRILRALLADRMGLVRATTIAAKVGKGFAVLFAIWGVLSFNLLLLVIAVVVFIGAEIETRAQVTNELIGEATVNDVMSMDVATISPDATVQEAAERMMRERRLAFAVADEEPIGVITIERIQQIPPATRAVTLVREVARVPPITPAMKVVDALRILDEARAAQVAVVDDGHVVGTFGPGDLERALKLRDLATDGAPRRRGAPAHA